MLLKEKTNPPRLVSLDTMRGFTMFWIVGGATLIEAIGKLGHNYVSDLLVMQMDHSLWEGLRFYDCIWPGFMLMVGVSIPYAYAKRSQTQTYSEMRKHALIRFLILFLLGSLRETVSLGELHLIELSSALQPIAIAYLVSFLLVRKSWKFQSIAALSILLIYGLAIELIPLPGVGAGSYTQNANLVWFVDSIFLPGRTNEYVFQAGWGTLISMIPAISTTILGMLIGELLKSSKSQINKLKILAMICAGILLAGFLTSTFIPVIMKMWTVSYGLLSAGWAATVLLLFYFIIDVQGYKKWTYFFIVIGVNALAVYLSSTVMNLSEISSALTSDFSEFVGNAISLLRIIVYIGLEWAILNWMYKHRIFLNP